MQDANNIYIRLINLQQPCSEETSQTIHYRSMADAVKGFEGIRSLATNEDSGIYAAQFCVNKKIISEYFLDKTGYTESLDLMGFSTSHAA